MPPVCFRSAAGHQFSGQPWGSQQRQQETNDVTRIGSRSREHTRLRQYFLSTKDCKARHWLGLEGSTRGRAEECEEDDEEEDDEEEEEEEEEEDEDEDEDHT